MKKRLISFVLAMMICFSVTGIFTAFAEETAPVRVGELTWLQEDSAERSATLAEIEEKIASLTGSGEQEESDERNLYSCEKEIICYDNLDGMLMALLAGDIDAAGLYSSVCRYITRRNDNVSIFGGDSFNESSPQSANRILELNLWTRSCPWIFPSCSGKEMKRSGMSSTALWQIWKRTEPWEA